MQRVPLLVLGLGLTCSGIALAQSPPLAVRGLDPVELCQGRETPGRADLETERAGYTYRFASPATRTTFQDDPARYEIQMGGGCARMGPLSGRGDPARFAVHDQRIYIFASDACRKGFLADPAGYIDRDDTLPELDEAQRVAGRALLDQVLDAHGGAAEIDRVQTLRLLSHKRVLQAGVAYQVREEWSAVLPDRVHHRTSWNESSWGETVRGEKGVVYGSDGERPMVASQHAEHLARWTRQLLPLLRMRARPGFVAGSLGSGEIAGVRVEQLVLACDGRTTVLGVDPDTHRAVALRYSARAEGPWADIEQRFEDFRSVGGLLLPYTARTRRNGKDRPSLDVAWTAIEIDAPIDESSFPK